MTVQLKDVLAERIDEFVVPVADLDAARAVGVRIRRRRRTVTGCTAALAAVAIAGGVMVTLPDGDGPSTASDPAYAALGQLDFTQGARAYADPGVTVHLGEKVFPYGDLEYLDTDATPTSHGIVFFTSGRPMLLDTSGNVTPLVKGPVDNDEAFHPTAKVDSRSPLVAWGTLRDGKATLTVRNLDTGKDIATATPDCGSCSELVIDAIDDGVVFVRDGKGTRTWDISSDTWRDFAGPETRVADVRNGVVLYSGPAPTAVDGWTLVSGVIDAQLTYDGAHVLSWTSTLRPTSPGGQPLVLSEGPQKEGDTFGWYAIDTDGSVLVATGKDYPEFTVYDCEVPSGTCEEIGTMTPSGGDPQFIGVDM